jgi:hypothetical protein
MTQEGASRDSGLDQRRQTPEAFHRGGERPEAQIRFRNYDHAQGYDVDLAIRRADVTGYEDRVYLQPGAVRCLRNLVPPGTWHVAVSIDNGNPRGIVCSIGPAIDTTVVVECGNGALSVTGDDWENSPTVSNPDRGRHSTGRDR